MNIRYRIKELRRVRAGDLRPHPKNWRTHPEEQQNALRGILAEVGIADALLVRETPEGLQLIDGHLRTDTAPDALWPRHRPHGAVDGDDAAVAAVAEHFISATVTPSRRT